MYASQDARPLDIALAPSLRDFVIEQAERGHVSAAEYVEALVRDHQRRLDQDRVAALYAELLEHDQDLG